MPPVAKKLDVKPDPESLPPADPCTLIIFGGSGDLARRRLIPALYNLLLDGLLPAKFAVLGLGRRTMSDEEYRASLREGVAKFSRQALDEAKWAAFAEHLFYLAGENEAPNTFTELKRRAEELEKTFGLPGNRIFYLSIPPVRSRRSAKGSIKPGWPLLHLRPLPTPASSWRSRWVATLTRPKRSTP